MKRIFIFLIGSLALVSCDKGENWWGKGPKPEPGVFSFNEKDIETLIRNIDECIGECEAFLLQLGISIEDIIAETNTLDQLELLRLAYVKIIEKDEWKDRFKVLSNLLMNHFIDMAVQGYGWFTA